MGISLGVRGGLKEIEYLFVDGGYFTQVVNKTAQRFFDSEHPPIDYKKLWGGFTKGFYYDCIPPRRKGEQDEEYDCRVRQQKTQFDTIRLTNGFHVFEGTTFGTAGKIRQKQIDVKIAVDMMSHSYRRNMHKATLLSGDLDFKPVVDAIIQDGMYVTLWSEKGSTSTALSFSSDARRELDIRTIHSFCTSDFQKRWPLPRGLSSQHKSENNGVLMKIGTMRGGVPIEKYRLNGTVKLIFPCSTNEGYYTSLEHADESFLYKYFEDVYQETIAWQ